MDVKTKQVSEIINNVDEKFPGERTVAMLEYFVGVINNFPIGRIKKIEHKILHTSRRWWTLEEWEAENDKIAEHEKVTDIGQRSNEMGNVSVEHPSFQKSANDSKMAKICKEIRKKHLGDCNAMGKAFVEAEKELPGQGLLKAGNNLIAHSLRIGSSGSPGKFKKEANSYKWKKV